MRSRSSPRPWLELFPGPSDLIICVEVSPPATVRTNFDVETRQLGISVEREDGNWYGAVPVPSTLDAENSTASFDDGVLAIRIPRIPEDAASAADPRLN
jgi:HSP20 family molecular chaperone IbpA